MAETISLDELLMFEITRKTDIRAVEALLANGASVDRPDESRTAPVIAAADVGWARCIELLAARGADLDVALVRSSPRANCKMHASCYSCLSKGLRALHVAVSAAQPAAAAALVKAGADANAVDDQGWTPLMQACVSPSMTKALLAAGVDATFANSKGMLALHMAAFNDDVDVMMALYAAAPATLNRLTNDGSTPLSMAAREGHIASTFFLLAQGASDEAVWSQRGMSSLWTAVENGHEKVVRLLLNAGTHAIGRGPMAIVGAMCRAAERGHARILEALLSFEGEQREQCYERGLAGNMPILPQVVMFAHPASVQACLAAGADENFATDKGLIPSDFIGVRMPGGKNKEAKKTAVRRLMKRAAACRARSLAWPAAPDRAAGGRPTAFDSSRRKQQAQLHVRIFRPRTDRFFTTRLARYSEK